MEFIITAYSQCQRGKASFAQKWALFEKNAKPMTY
jgi:hypothetical protein